MKLRIPSFILILLLPCTSICFSQDATKYKRSRVRLLEWNAEACDNTYDPYRLQNRITHWEVKNGIASITINFSDNCCASFKPSIEFKANRLKLFPYKVYTGDYCSCNCCFSIKFEIQGIEGKDIEVYFINDKLNVSSDHYKTIEPTYVVHEGRKINYVNRYGFKEGIWIEFFDDGNQKSVTKYPESSLYYEPNYEWSRRYYKSGRLSFYSRNDTIETWFEDGEQRSQTIKYSLSDTTFEKRIMKHENRQLEERSLERHYPVIFMSEFDSTYRVEGYMLDYVYREEYYSNGRMKYLVKNDTSYAWYETGQLQYKQYHTGKVEYSEQGKEVQKTFRWKEPGMKGWGDLDYSVYIQYYESGNLEEIHFVRDEPSEDRKSLAPGVHYYWKWNKEATLIESPENWKEDYPWMKIDEIKLLLTKYKLH